MMYIKSALRLEQCASHIFTSGKPQIFILFYAGMVWSCRTGSVRIRGHGRPEAASKSNYRLLFSGANATGGLKIPRSPKYPRGWRYSRCKKNGSSRLMLNKC